jgi:fatty acid desaturase
MMPLSSDNPTAGEVCLPNINLRERRRRLAVGIGQFFVCLVVLALLIASGLDRWWRLALFPMFTGAAVGFFQWRDKT